MATFTRPFSVTGLASGLGSALEYTVVSTDGTTVLVSRRSTGVAEVLGSGAYRVAVAGFDSAWSGFILWTTASGATLEALEEFQAVNLQAVTAVLYGASGSIEFTYTVFKPGGVTPLSGAAIYVSSDLAGTLRSEVKISDALGRTVWLLDPGTVYFWRSAAGYLFSNPDVEVVS